MAHNTVCTTGKEVLPPHDLFYFPSQPSPTVDRVLMHFLMRLLLAVAVLISKHPKMSLWRVFGGAATTTDAEPCEAYTRGANNHLSLQLLSGGTENAFGNGKQNANSKVCFWCIYSVQKRRPNPFNLCLRARRIEGLGRLFYSIFASRIKMI